MELFLVRISPYLSVFSPNAGKYGLEKTPYLDTFHAVVGLAEKSTSLEKKLEIENFVA